MTAIFLDCQVITILIQILHDICILSLKLPGYGHWSLYYKGKYFDPEFGILKECPKNSKLCYYWEIMN